MNTPRSSVMRSCRILQVRLSIWFPRKSRQSPEDDPMAFQLVLNDILGDGNCSGTSLGHLDELALQLVLCKAYVLADKIGRPDISARMDCSFINCILVPSALHPAPPRCLSPLAVRFVYQNTSDQVSCEDHLQSWR